MLASEILNSGSESLDRRYPAGGPEVMRLKLPGDPQHKSEWAARRATSYLLFDPFSAACLQIMHDLRVRFEIITSATLGSSVVKLVKPDHESPMPLKAHTAWRRRIAVGVLKITSCDINWDSV
jgi:hypothetical protein